MAKKDVGDEALPTSRDAIQNLARIAWPSVLESMLIAVISIVDTIMVSSLGKEAIAAVGLSTQPRFIILAIFMSLNTGITAVIARRRGEQDREGANRALRQIMLFSTIASIVLGVVGVLCSRSLLLFVGAKPDTIDLATTYCQIILGGMVFNVISMNLNAAQRGAGNTRITMKTNIIANLVNVVFNYLLIGGRLGFPRLGIAGAAIATVLGFVVASVISIASMRKQGEFLFLDFTKSFLPQKKVLAPVAQVASSAAVEQVFMRIGFLVFAKMIANLGTDAYATHQIVINIMNIAFAFGDGLSISTASLVGQNLGRGMPGAAQLYGLLSQRVGLTVGAVMFTAFILLRHVLILPFTTDPGIILLGSQLLIVLAFVVPAQISQMIFSTCLRVSGDTRYVAVVSLLSITLLRSALAYLFCYPLGLGLVGAWLGMAVDQYIRLMLNGLRFAKGKWKKIAL